jgi:hypothetical protein
VLGLVVQGASATTTSDQCCGSIIIPFGTDPWIPNPENCGSGSRRPINYGPGSGSYLDNFVVTA